MPIYEYEREDGTRFDHIQSIKDDPLKKCPDTGQKVKRMISGGVDPIIKGWSPDKERRKKEWIQKNPYGTTLPEYQKKIDENTQKAYEEEAKRKSKGNVTEI